MKCINCGMRMHTFPMAIMCESKCCDGHTVVYRDGEGYNIPFMYCEKWLNIYGSKSTNSIDIKNRYLVPITTYRVNFKIQYVPLPIGDGFNSAALSLVSKIEKLMLVL